MLDISNIRVGTLIDLEGTPYKVLFAQHNFVGRGGATMRTRLKNLLNGSVQEKTLRSADKISPADIEYKDAQYLYMQGSEAVFMDNQNYEQHSLGADLVEDKIPYMKESQAVNLVYFGGKVIEIALPNSVQLTVTESDPGVKGDTATAAQKTCKVETGLVVTVPLFIKQGDVLKIDTRTGHYLERVK